MKKSKRIATYLKKDRKVEVWYYYEDEEFRCLLFLGGSLYNTTYCTDTKERAIIMAKEMVK